jgi:hypothetical protein
MQAQPAVPAAPALPALPPARRLFAHELTYTTCEVPYSSKETAGWIHHADGSYERAVFSKWDPTEMSEEQFFLVGPIMIVRS